MTDNTVTFHVQCGPYREQKSMKRSEINLQSIKESAWIFLSQRFASDVIGNLHNRTCLFRHDSSSEHFLQRVQSATEVTDGVLLEIVFSGDSTASPSRTEEINPHMFVVETYKVPTFCDSCGGLLMGLARQGMQCECCGLNCHKKCAYNIPNNCSYAIRKPDLELLHSQNDNKENGNTLDVPMYSTTRRRTRSVSPSTSIRPPIVDQIMSKRIKVPHSFVIKSYNKPTVCRYCGKLLKGLFRQGHQCKDCKINCHEKCLHLAPHDCAGEAPDVEVPASVAGASMVEPDVQIAVTPTDSDPEEPPSSAQGNTDNQITVRRIHQSVKNTGSVDNLPVLKEGWLPFFTSRNPRAVRHYWKLNSKRLLIYQSDTDYSIVNKIPLERLFSLDPGAEYPAPHIFQLRTNHVMIYAGDRHTHTVAEEWATRIKFALMPIGQMPERTKVYMALEDVFACYQIFPDDILGAGQFGTVYDAVHRPTSKAVAVKVTEKPRLSQREAARMKAEVEIMRTLDHPGVVAMDGFFENTKKIFIVMEKLNSDMLKFILSSEKKRLPERTGRFLTYQILAALGYLHSKKIAHCDLKPENILLASDAEFPQLKLCDFGFAKIIGEQSFRRSVVGTPAYLAPEALKSNKRYNRLLDMWSIGIIMYVTMAGVFPFHENEDIADQIKNAAFLFPKQPWEEMTKEAIDLIKHLLVVEIKNRYTVYRAAQHPWFLDYQMYADLRHLESKVGVRYLTHEADDVRWEEYRKSRNLPGFAPSQPDYFMMNYEDSDDSDEENRPVQN